MTEDENTIEGNAEEIEFQFLVQKMESGNCVIKPIEPAPDTLDEVYAACESVLRNIQAQHIAQLVMQGMGQMLAAPPTPTRQNQTENGLYIPNDIQVKK